MDTHPTDPAPWFSVVNGLEYTTDITEINGARELLQSRSRFPKIDVSLLYQKLSSTKIDTLWNFFVQQKGQSTYFYLWTLTLHAYVDLRVGRGDNSATDFDLPGTVSDTATLTCYVNSVLTGHTLSAGAGEGGVDRVSFAAAPATGSLITADFTGKIRPVVRYKNPRMSREQFVEALFSTSLEFIGWVSR